jgi:tetratricopeptide (TPR) repeat protein
MPCITLSSGFGLNLTQEAFKEKKFMQSLCAKNNERMQSAAEELATRIKTLGENHPDVADSYQKLGGICYNRREYEYAVTCMQKALEIRAGILGPDHPDLAELYKSLGEACNNNGDKGKAVEYFQKHFDILLKQHGEHSQETKNAAYYVESTKTDFLIQTLGEDHPDLAPQYMKRGNQNLNDMTDHAIDYYRKSLKIQLANLGQDHPDVGRTYNNLGLAYTQKNEYGRALAYYRKALQIYRVAHGVDRLCIGRAYHNLGLVYACMDDHDRAVTYYKKAIRVWRKSPAKNFSDMAAALINLGVSYYFSEDYELAINCYEKSLKIRNQKLRQDHPDMVVVLKNLCAAYEQKGDYDRAAEYCRQVLEIFRNGGWEEDHRRIRTTKEKIIKLYRKKNQAGKIEFRFDAKLVFLDKDTGKKKGKLKVEIPETIEEQKKGLMHRTEMRDNQAMMFVYDPEDIMIMWTKDTLIPLDIIFVSRDNRIISIHENSDILSKKLISSQETGRITLETKAGFCEKNSIQCGDSIKIIR